MKVIVFAAEARSWECVCLDGYLESGWSVQGHTRGIIVTLVVRVVDRIGRYGLRAVLFSAVVTAFLAGALDDLEPSFQ